MRTAKNYCPILERKINTLLRCGVLLERINPANQNQRGFRFSRSCFIRHPENGRYVRIVGFVENNSSRVIEIICINCGDGTREKLSLSSYFIKGHLYSAVSQEEKYDNRPKNEELYVIAPTKKEANSVIKDLSQSGFWSLDRNIRIKATSLNRIV